MAETMNSHSVSCSISINSSNFDNSNDNFMANTQFFTIGNQVLKTVSIANYQQYFTNPPEFIPIIYASNYQLFIVVDKSVIPFLNNLRKLNDIRKLKDNWNDNGAKTFKNELLTNVESLLKRVSNQPEIFPTANHSIQLEYRNAKDDYLEYEYFENGAIKEFFYSHDKKKATKYITRSTMLKNIKDFYA